MNTIYEQFDVVVVPIPFTNRKSDIRRPALILSDAPAFNNRVNHSVMAMITSAKNEPWPLDTPIDDTRAAGLFTPSVVRMKLFTLEHKYILDCIGSLSTQDRLMVKSAFPHVFKLN
ncbi:MAG: type II toxin-antitoxin system PemK/MazF family toxin [Synechocystis sp.]|nr:type II toxin-antitoxin system PemK/MazF family toxin [Synechocystis sp.]